VPAFKSFYKIDEVWSAESRERLRRNRATGSPARSESREGR